MPLSDNPIDRDRRSHHQPIHRTFSARKMLADHMGIDLRGGNIRMKEPNPVNIGFLGSQAVAAGAHKAANVIEKGAGSH